jgi:hypothetical protein
MIGVAVGYWWGYFGDWGEMLETAPCFGCCIFVLAQSSDTC